MKPLSVSFIGAGNLAWHLSPALDNTGYAVREVFSRKEKNAQALAERLYQCEATTSLDFSSSSSQLFIIAVSDDVVQEIVSRLTLPADAILVHTSGSQPMDMLNESGAAGTGVVYPLQTFTKARKVDFQQVPFFVESEDPVTEKILIALAKSLSKKVVTISSEERVVLHMAAVFASNFSNHMLTLSKRILVSNRMSFDLVKPLIAETINKSLELGPEKAQTGPAKRGDLEILDKHIELLNEDASVAEIYKNISQHIIDYYGVD